MKNKVEFYQEVYNIVRKIPEGKVSTYGHIAAALGNKSLSRVVGYAMNSVKENDIPCHRVVNRNGELTGSIHFATATLMKELLLSENIEFINNRVNLSKHLWIPEQAN